MSNTALYNKWRSQTFDQILGQEHVTRTLQNQIRAGRIGHAYLFTGLRGTGKTTMARVFARAINCVGDTGEPPCNECHICQSLLAGRSLDLTEIDGASNRGIEEIRDLRDKVNFAPNECRYKVYVIDEVHMLTREAFNALLKTLEEPPEHVVFVFCTTEPYRLPDTVLSRCQRFDFRRGSLDSIRRKLEMICENEGLDIDEQAIAYVARRGAGSYRDAESLLDQLSAFEGTRITLERVQSLLGSTSSDIVIRLVSSVVTGDTVSGIDAVRAAFDGGAEPRQFLADIIEAFRALMLLRVGSSAETTSMTPEDLDELRALLEGKVSLGTVLRAIKLFNDASQGLRFASRPEIPIELALVEASMGIGDKHRIESSSKSQEPVSVSRSAADTRSKPRPAPSVRAKAPRPTSGNKEGRSQSEAVVTETRAAPVASETAQVQPSEASSQRALEPELTLEWVKGHWRQVMMRVRSVNRQVQALLNSVRPVEIRDGVIVLGCESGFHRDKLQAEERRVIVERVLSEVLGTDCRVTFTVSGAAPVQSTGNMPADIFTAADPKSKARERMLNHPAVKEAQRRGMKVTGIQLKDDPDQEGSDGQ